jgi:hypothetical protein
MENINHVLSDIEKQFVQMRASGSTIRDIAKSLGKSTHTICDWNKKYFKDIIDIQSEEFRELQKKILSYKSARLDLLKDELDRIKKTWAGQDLEGEMDDDWDIDKYINTVLKLSDVMDKFELDMLSMASQHKNIRTANVLNTEGIEEEENLTKEETGQEIASVANTRATVFKDKIADVEDEKVIENTELKT